jgi:hypothetical protein
VALPETTMPPILFPVTVDPVITTFSEDANIPVYLSSCALWVFRFECIPTKHHGLEEEAHFGNKHLEASTQNVRDNGSILRLPILPATQPFNSVSGEGYPPGPIKGRGFVEYGHSRLRNQLSTTQYSVAHHSEPARRKSSKEEKSKQVNVRCGVVFLKRMLGRQQITI